MGSRLLTGGLVAALVALLATNPVVVEAAGQITGKDIKDGSVKGVDVAEGTFATVPDAARLDGRKPESYRALGAQGVSTPLAVPGNTFARIIAPVGITVPADVGLLRISASATFSGSPTNVTMWFQVDEDTCGNSTGAGHTYRPFGNTTQQDSLAYTLLVPTSPGPHTVVLCAVADTAVTASNPVLAVETVAAGSAGGVTSKQQAPDRDGNPATVR